MFECWESQAAPETFRTAGLTRNSARRCSLSVQERDIANVRRVFGSGVNLQHGATLERWDPRLGAVVTRKATARERTNP
jgi:hypothetical protein